MTRSPERTSNVFLIGAGLGSAFGIPNTQQLLNEVHQLSNEATSWASTKELGDRLEEAYSYLYPIAATSDEGFRPSVVDFFSILKTYTEVSEGLPDRLAGTRELLHDLTRALANVLVNRLRDAEVLLQRRQPELERILQPGNLVITSNWDLLLERYAQIHGYPIRHRLVRHEEETTVLKLHGSIDWCLRGDARRGIGASTEYRTIRERLFGPRPYYIKPIKDDAVLRTCALENWSQAWSRIKSRSITPLMITMALGKASDLLNLRPVWRDAYGALSRASNLEILGYSMPDDDLEIRTLIVAGLERAGGDQVEVEIRNPSPEVHNRFRASVRREFRSSYVPVGAAT